MRTLVVCLLALLATVVVGAEEFETTQDVLDEVAAQYTAQWWPVAGTGRTGIKQALLDACASDTYKVWGTTAHCPAGIYNEDTEPFVLPFDVFPMGRGETDFPDVAPPHQPNATVKAVLLALNPATGVPYVDPTQLTKRVSLEFPECGDPRGGASIGVWARLCLNVTEAGVTNKWCRDATVGLGCGVSQTWYQP